MGRNTQSVSELKADILAVQQELNLLRQKVERQNRLLKSTWIILKQKFDLDDSDIENVMRDVITEEKQHQSVAKSCSKCSRPLQSNNSAVCIYCGAESAHVSLF